MAPQREWFEKDYYKVLGVPETASAKEITKAYRKLARQNHPDANSGDPGAEERFKEISAAYDVVGDEAKRKEYDEVRKLGPLGGGFGPGGFGAGGPGGGGGNQGFSFTFDGGNDVGDLLGNLFGRGRRRGGAGPASGVGPRRGEDIEAELGMSFADAVEGVSTTLYLTSDAVCSTCSGSGARPGTQPRVCPVCQGRGVVDDNQGLFSFSQPCPNCHGNGVLIEDPCPTCHGTGVERRQREVKVRIPAGVDDGQRIRLKGRGGPGRNGGPPGDLYVTVHVQPDPTFSRDGDNLLVRVPVDFAVAALGGEVSVPLLDGGTVTVRVRPGTQPGAKYRVKGKGVAAKRGAGDLLAVIEVSVPTALTEPEREAIEQLRQASAAAKG
jgi:molecular chaperone DnaJ